MKISVIGTGYVGLVTGTCFAETGNDVICVDIDEKKVKMMRDKKVPIYEPGLDVIFKRNIEAERLIFTTDLKKAVENSDIIFLALPTPPGADGSADLSFVLDVSEKIAKMMTEYKVIVNKSTVPVGTAEKTTNVIKQHTNIDFDVVSNPEFLREGFAVEDFLKPDRVVVGTTSEKAKKILEKLYKPYIRSGNPLIFMDEKSSELTKYASNSFLATKITFMNEISNFCENVGADVDMVRKGMGTDSRIGKRFLFPGVGYGGSCFPKDVKALIKSGKKNNFNFEILESVEEVNENQKTSLIPKLEKYFNGDIKGKKIGLWGLAFKPETDDIREAPSLYIINELLNKGAKIVAFDPEASENVKEIIGDKITFTEKALDATENIDALMIITEWSVFRNLPLEQVKDKMNSPVIFDGRNIYDIKDMEGAGFYYESMGRKIVVN